MDGGELAVVLGSHMVCVDFPWNVHIPFRIGCTVLPSGEAPANDMSSGSSQWFCDGQSVLPLDGYGDCGLAGGRVVQVHKCNLQTTSAHPSIPNLVTGIGLSTFPLLSG